MDNFWHFIKENKNPIVLYGTGNGADKLIDKLSEMNLEVSAVFASDGFVRNRTFRGFEVISYSDVLKRFEKPVVLLAFGSDRSYVMENIKKIALNSELYAPHIPLFDEDYFTAEFCDANRDSLSFVYDALCDEQSRKVFSSVLSYRLSASLNYLYGCETTVCEAYKKIICPSEDEIYIDVGAYNGDTVREFLFFAPNYKHIFAVEADKKNYAKLVKSTASLNALTAINACCASKNGLAVFSTKGGRQSSLAEEGEKLRAVSIDEMLNGEKATYIKIDSEGSEHDVLLGAKKTITKYKPKLRVAAYHLVGDIFNIPKQVLGYRNDYRVFMRHFPCVPDWNTDFYFI